MKILAGQLAASSHVQTLTDNIVDNHVNTFGILTVSSALHGEGKHSKLYIAFQSLLQFLLSCIKFYKYCYYIEIRFVNNRQFDIFFYDKIIF